MIDTDATRRAMLQAGLAAGALAGLVPSAAQAQKAPPGPLRPDIRRKPSFDPKAQWPVSVKGDSATTPFGTVVLGTRAGARLPVLIRTHDGQGVFDAQGNSVFVKLGTGAAAVTIIGHRVQLGEKSKLVPMAGDNLPKIVKYISSNRALADAAMRLRGALLTAYPVAIAATGGKPEETFARAEQKAAAGAGRSRKQRCTTTTITETVTTTFTETVNVVRTAEEQWDECIRKAKCAANDPLCYAGAVAVCSLQAFVDIVTGVISVVTTLVEEVTREVVTCTLARLPAGQLPNEWFASGTPLAGMSLAGPEPQTPDSGGNISASLISRAIEFLKQQLGFAEPYVKAFLGAQWSLAEIPTPVPNGAGGTLGIPYGISCCLTAEAADSLTLPAMWDASSTLVMTMLTLLVALSPEAATVLGSLVPTAPLLGAAIAAAGAAVVSVATIILCFMIVTLFFGVLISGQLSLAKALGAFEDGKVCLVHPTFVLAMVEMYTIGIAPTEWIPPIVTG